jgi:hypothetical protein
MNDDDAKYLIDQFNKYASWKTKRDETALVSMALVTALTAATIALLARVTLSDMFVMFILAVASAIRLLVLCVPRQESLRIR